MNVGAIFSRALRLARKPPGYLVKRLAQEARMEAERVLAPTLARRTTGEALARMAGFADVDGLWDMLAERPYPAVTADLDAATFSGRFPQARDDILAAAERAVRHEVDLLGTGKIDLGAHIDWLKDFKTGDRWEPQFCRAIDYVNKGRPSDVKVPWEISRLHWLLPVGQAYLLTGEERFAEAVRDVLEQWMEANPYAWSVNWSCTMEPALRLQSWTWLFHVFAHAPSWADSRFRSRLLGMLYLHGAFTETHIERSTINGNHLTADAAGLVFAGLFFKGIGDADRWAAEGWLTLEGEIELQVHPDGVDFEASSAYHRLVTELFAMPARYRLAVGETVAKPYADRLAAMAKFSLVYMRPDGTSPHWGDADDARSLPLGTQLLGDHRYLAGLVGLTVNDAELLCASWGSGDEIAWHCGLESLVRKGPERSPGSTGFPDGGVYILRNASNHVFIDCGPVGLAGLGGHGHNDALSFEAWLGGNELIVDSGSFVYTASFEDRNAFRATAAHNTPRIGGEEINRFYAPDNLWNLHEDARAQRVSFEATVDGGRFAGEHFGYARLSQPVVVKREITLSADRLTVLDTMDGEGEHEIEIPLHFASGVTIEPSDGKGWLMQAKGSSYSLSAEHGGEWRATIEDARVSPSYGVAFPSKRLVFRTKAPLPARLGISISVTVPPGAL